MAIAVALEPYDEGLEEYPRDLDKAYQLIAMPDGRIVLTCGSNIVEARNGMLVVFKASQLTGAPFKAIVRLLGLIAQTASNLGWSFFKELEDEVQTMHSEFN